MITSALIGGLAGLLAYALGARSRRRCPLPQARALGPGGSSRPPVLYCALCHYPLDPFREVRNRRRVTSGDVCCGTTDFGRGPTCVHLRIVWG